MIKELYDIASGTVRKDSPSLQEASITALGKSGHYSIKFQDGSTASNVKGPSSLKVGQNVAVSRFPGNSNLYLIVGSSYMKTHGTIREVSV